jgi:hypothetical protein
VGGGGGGGGVGGGVGVGVNEVLIFGSVRSGGRSGGEEVRSGE